MRTRAFVFTLAVLFLALPACDDDPTGPEGEDTTFPLERKAEVTDMSFWVPADSIGPSSATATLEAESPTEFTLEVRAQGLPAGHAFTVWGFDARALAGGLVASGVSGADGSLTVAGSNCVGAEQTDTGLGIAPGTPPACDVIDLSTPVPDDLEATLTGIGLPASADDDFVQGLTVFLVDHGAWEGSTAALTTTEGIAIADGAFRFDLSNVFGS